MNRQAGAGFCGLASLAAAAADQSGQPQQQRQGKHTTAAIMSTNAFSTRHGQLHGDRLGRRQAGSERASACEVAAAAAAVGARAAVSRCTRDQAAWAPSSVASMRAGERTTLLAGSPRHVQARSLPELTCRSRMDNTWPLRGGLRDGWQRTKGAHSLWAAVAPPQLLPHAAGLPQACRGIIRQQQPAVLTIIIIAPDGCRITWLPSQGDNPPCGAGDGAAGEVAPLRRRSLRPSFLPLQRPDQASFTRELIRPSNVVRPSGGMTETPVYTGLTIVPPPGAAVAVLRCATPRAGLRRLELAAPGIMRLSISSRSFYQACPPSAPLLQRTRQPAAAQQAPCVQPQPLLHYF